MLPDQPGAMAIRAIVYLKKGILYQTEIVDNLLFSYERNAVCMYKCYPFSPCFGSRMSNIKTANITLPYAIENIEKAQLLIKNWGKYYGLNEDPFKINGHPYDLFSDHVSGLISFSRININTDDVVSGKNVISVLLDTEHHSLGIFLLGSVLLIKEKSEK